MSLIAYDTANVAGAGTATTPAKTTTGATALFVCVVAVGVTHPASGATVSDSKSNTYTAYSNYSGGGNGNIQVCIFRCLTPTVGTSHTASASIPSGNGCTIFFLAFDVVSVADAATGQSNVDATTIQPGITTPSSATNLVLTIVAVYQTASPLAINSAFTIAGENLVSGASYGGAVAYKLNQSGAVNPTWSNIDNSYGSEGPAAAIICLKAAAAATRLAPGTVKLQAVNRSATY